MDTPQVRVIKIAINQYNVALQQLSAEIERLAASHVPVDSGAFLEYYRNAVLEAEMDENIGYLRGREESLFGALIEKMENNRNIMRDRVSSARGRIVELRTDTASKNHTKLSDLFRICDELDYYMQCLLCLRK